MALPTRVVTIPFSAGLGSKGDPLQQQPPLLSICVDAEFDQVGALRTRKPFSTSIVGVGKVGGGNLTDDGSIRKLVANGAELVAMSPTNLYSWFADASGWVQRDERPALAIHEQNLFNVDNDQVYCDRAELSGIVVYMWSTYDVGAGVSRLFLGAIDQATGSVVAPPTQIAGRAGSPFLARLVVLQTKILVFVTNPSTVGIDGAALDPTAIAASIASIAFSTISTTSGGGVFDVEQIPGTDTAILAAPVTSTSYQVLKVTSALAITSATRTSKPGASILAIACNPAGTTMQLFRAPLSSTTYTITSDEITISSLADGAHVGVAVATTSNQSAGGGGAFTYNFGRLTAAYRNDGTSRCEVFWSVGDVQQGVVFDGTGTHVATWPLSTATVDETGAIAAGVVIGNLSPVSRAFAYGGRVYCWVAFAGASGSVGSPATIPYSQIQNTHFLMRDDGLVFGKCAPEVGGGFAYIDTPETLPAQLSSVQSLGGGAFVWGGLIRRIVPEVSPTAVTTTTIDAHRAPREVLFTFDDARARRAVRLGATLYMTGAQIEQYDGVSVCELGWQIFPWDLIALPVGSGGNLSAGGYTYKVTARQTNMPGEIDRSTTSYLNTVTAVASDSVGIQDLPIMTTRRRGTIRYELWRTQVNPPDGAPFFLAGWLNSGALVRSLGYTDALADTDLTTQPEDLETGAVLPAIAPPASNVIASSQFRIFLGDVANAPDTVWYSMPRSDGFVATFNEALTFIVPPDGGAITAIIPFSGGIVVARETAIYIFSGDGLDSTAAGTNFAYLRTISASVGILNQESYVYTDAGVFLKSAKGWYLIDQGWNLQYIGAGVAKYDGETIAATHEMATAQHQIRALSSQRLLVFDTLAKEWAEWSVTGGVSACIWQGQYVYTDGTSIFVQRTDFTGVTYGKDVEISWWKVNDVMGRGIVRAIQLLAEWQSACNLRIRIARNYESDGAGGASYNEDIFWPTAGTVVGAPVQVKKAPRIKSPIQSIKIRFTEYATDNVSAPSGEGLRYANLALACADEDGLFTGLSAAQKA